MNEDLKILKTIVKICHNYLQKGEEIDFVINERHLQAIENVLEERKKDKTKLKELEEENMQKDLEKIGIEENIKADMKEIIERYYTANEECISKQKIKDAVEKIAEYKIARATNEGYYYEYFINQDYKENFIKLFNELLENN